MSIHIFELPDLPAEQTAWLQNELLGDRLHEVVAELQMAFGDPREVVSLEAILGDLREPFLSEGLSAIESTTLSRLVRSPRSLLNLQELALREGGDWVEDHLQGVHRVHESTKTVRVQLEEAFAVKPAPRRVSPVLLFGGVVAAVLLAMVIVYYGASYFAAPSGPTKWGWLAPDAFAGEHSRESYMMQVAGGADAWFAKRPSSAEAISKRTEEFIAGCDLVIQAEHEPLQENDRVWLRQKCRDWRSDLQTELRALNQGAAALKTRGNIDNIARRMAEVIRSRVTP